MKIRLRMYCVSCLVTLGAVQLSAQTYHWIHSSENDTWQQSTVRLKSEVNTLPDVSVDEKAKITTFKTWGITFNELCWDALGVLTREEQDEILKKVFAPDGDLRIGRGRISLGANDYARSWYSCDEVEGDFELRYFNIDRDKQAIIPFIRAAQKYNPALTFWVSPWSPPQLVENKWRLSGVEQSGQSSVAEVGLPAVWKCRRNDRFGRDEAGGRT